MPRRRTVRKRRPRRRVYRKRRRVTPSRCLGPLRNSQVAKLIYHDQFSIDPAVAAAGNQVFSCNGVYDPDITGVGHQPRGFDQMIAMYDHCVVIGFKFTAWVHPDDTSEGTMIALRVKDSSTVTTVIDDIMEDRYVKLISLGSDNNSKRISLKCNPNKFLSRSKPLSDPDLKNSSASNPTEQAFLHVSAFSIHSGVDLSPLRGTARIEYTCVFFEPKQLAIS